MEVEFTPVCRFQMISWSSELGAMPSTSMLVPGTSNRICNLRHDWLIQLIGSDHHPSRIPRMDNDGYVSTVDDGQGESTVDTYQQWQFIVLCCINSG